MSEWLKFVTGDRVRGTEEETEAFFKQVEYRKAPRYRPATCLDVYYRKEYICTINSINSRWTTYPLSHSYSTKEQAVLVQIELNYKHVQGQLQKVNGNRSANWCRAHKEAIEQILSNLSFERKRYEMEGIFFKNDNELACAVVQKQYDRVKDAVAIDPCVKEQYLCFIQQNDISKKEVELVTP